MDKSIRVAEETHDRLTALAQKEDETIGGMLAKLVDFYEEQRFWAAVHDGYAELRSDTKAWEGELKERGELDGTLLDGLDDRR